MTSTIQDRFNIVPEEGIKAPCRMATTANITLSGLQTVDGISGAENDRVLVKDQTAGSENGIYTMQLTAWVRASDWDDNSDVVSGMLVSISDGTVNGQITFQASFSGTFTIDTTAPVFAGSGIVSEPDKRYGPVFATVAAMVAANPVSLDGVVVDLVVGMTVAIDDYATGNDSGMLFGRVVAASTGTPDGGSFIDLANGFQFRQNFPTEISVKMFGASDANSDNQTNLQAAIDYAQSLSPARVTTPLNKRRVENVEVELGSDGSFVVDSSVELKNGVSLSSKGAEIKASATFADTSLLTTDTVEDYVYGNISGVRLNGNNLAIVGLDIVDSLEISIDKCHIERCGDDGIIVRAGAGAFIHQTSIVGVDATAASPATDAAGIHFVNSDHHATDVEISGYPIGVHVEGPFNRLVSVHAWSIGTDHVIMKHGFLIEGEHVYLANCVADSPFVLDTGQAPSKTNGGFGFFIDTNAVRTCLVNCTSEWTTQTGFVTSTVKGFFVGKSFTNMVNCSTRDFTALSMVIEQIEYVSTAIRRATNLIGGTVVGSTGDLVDLPSQFEGMFNPEGTVDLRIGGASTGITYTRQSINYEIHGGFLLFVISMKLSSKGSLTGALTIGDLPKALIDLTGTGGEVAFTCYIKNNFKPALAILDESGVSLELINSTTGVALLDSDILNTTDFYISGSYPWTKI